MAQVGHLQIQVTAARFVVKEGHRVKSLKPFLTPNPSLSRNEEHPLSKKEVAVSQQLSELKD